MDNRKVIVYIAASLDGYIAGKNDSLDFLKTVEAPPEDYGYADFVQSVDTVIMGRKTYDIVMGFGMPWSHTGKKAYVISRSKKGSDDNVEYHDNAPELIAQLKQADGKNIFIDGGSELIHQLMQSGLVDTFIISVIPALLGEGIPLFRPGFEALKLKLLRSTTFPSGLVQLWYERAAPEA